MKEALVSVFTDLKLMVLIVALFQVLAISIVVS
jgi:hypothetical protein